MCCFGLVPTFSALYVLYVLYVLHVMYGWWRLKAQNILRIMQEPAKNVELPMPWRECPFDKKKWAKVLMPPNKDLYYVASQSHSFDAVVSIGSRQLHCIENIDTGVQIILQLARTVGAGNDFAPNMSLEYVIQNLVVLGGGNGDIRGTDLRDIPVKAILSAYAQHDTADILRFNRTALLDFPESKGIPKKYWDEDVNGQMDTVYPPTNILDPLPAQYSRRPWFYALVAEQYDALAEKYPNDNTANRMIELNEPYAKKSTVQRWLTEARKRGLLAPADWKRGE